MAKEGKNWFSKHKVLTVILVIIGLIIIGGIAGGSGDDKTSNNGSSTAKAESKQKSYRFNDRADKQEKDVEVTKGETANVGGIKMTATKVEYKPSFSEYEKAGTGKTYVVVDVSLENTSNETKPYNAFDFRVQTVSGQVLDGTIVTLPNPLNSGDLVSGGKVSGSVVFEVPVETGHQYMIWKPSPFNADRAILQLN